MFALFAFACGIAVMIGSRVAAKEIGAGLATHELRENRSRWLDPVFSERQILIGIRAWACFLFVVGAASGIMGLTG
jgi:hypothetical protein